MKLTTIVNNIIFALNLKATLNSPNFTGTPKIDGINLSANKGKNLLINANGIINQREYVSGTATTVANQYTLDGWRVVVSGQNLAFSTVNGITTFTAPAGGIEQVVENSNVIGGDYVFEIGGTATAVISQSADNITYTTVVPDEDGIYTITGGNYVKVKLSSGTFILPQLERGTAKTTFEEKSKDEELRACRWRYRRLLNVSANGNVAHCPTTTSATFAIQLGEPMRVAPIGVTAGSVIRFYSAGAYKTVSSWAITGTTQTDISITLTLSTAVVAGATGYTVTSTDGTQRIELSADL